MSSLAPTAAMQWRRALGQMTSPLCSAPMQPQPTAAARQMLGGRLLVFAGDSIARNLYGATLRLLGTPGQDIVVGHQDFAHELEGGISLQFFWAPYPANLTAVLGRLATGQAEVPASRRLLDDGQLPPEQQAAAQQAGQVGKTPTAQQQGEAAVAGGTSNAASEGQQQQQEQPQQQEQQQQQERPEAAAAEAATEPSQQAHQPAKRPALVTLSGTLWHLLHMTAADDFEAQLGSLGRVAAALAASAADQAGGSSSSGGGTSPRLVLASGTEMFPNRMKTVQKQHSMTSQNLDAYNRAMQQAGLLAPAGPFALLDLLPLTQHCGEECSTDGVHSMPLVGAMMEASAGAAAPAPAAAPPASPASVPSAAAVRSPAKGAASPKPLLTRYAPPSTDRCPACGAPPLSEQDLAIVRKPGRRSTRDPEDPRNREQNLVTREFLEKHIVEARMSLRDIGCFHGYTISTLSRRAKQEAVLVGARARNAAEAAASQQDGTQPQGGPATKPAPRRKPSSSNKSRRKSQAAGGEDEVEDGSEAEGVMPHWQPVKRQRRAPGPAHKPPLGAVGMGSLPPLPLVPLPLAGMALPMPAFIQPPASLDAQQLQMAQIAQMRIIHAQREQNEIFAHVLAQTRPPPPAPTVVPAAQPAVQQGGSDGKERGAGVSGQADDEEEREADTDEEDVAELLGLLRHRSPACPSSLPPPPPPGPPAAAVAAAETAPAAAAAAPSTEQQQAAKQEGEQLAAKQEQQAAIKQEEQPGAAGEPQAAAPSEQQPAAAAAKQEVQPAEKQELPQLAASDAHAEQPVQPPKKEEEEGHAAASQGDLALDPALAPSTAPIDDPHLQPLCLSQPVSLAAGGTEPCSPTAASQPQAAASQQPEVHASQPEPAEFQGSQQPAGSQAGEGQGSHQVGGAPQQASQHNNAPHHAAWADQGSQPGSQPDGPAGSLSPQMAAVKSSATQLALGRAIEAFQAADIDSSVSMLLPLRRLQRAGKGGSVLQQVVARWNDFPLARQQDLFSAAVLHALEGRWEALEADLALELAAGN
ncbi:hypothetical protein C2E21_7895 [Chlorella sorokiniana]|uniref:Uncharacterized protein n=1 Tax=Chlorella sorokiniana TaxID=3076 RepID=A0A2P6TGS0_CHLSO|nr:hypothetical protein C2E21_7895 [Chlorella sorokiniana]|eukprot:PRW33305.1 hypothetical protein C2E21_7895 [Chlorella sorokiniana]